MEWDFSWNHTHDFKIEWVRSMSLIWNHNYDFRSKLHNTRFHYHFIAFILKLPMANTRLGQFKYSIDAALSQFEIKLIHFWEGKSKSLGNKSCKICHMILFVFHFPAIWLVTLNKPWDQIGCFVFSVTFSLALQGPLVYTSTIVLAINFWTRQSACTKSAIHLFIVIILKANADSLNCSDEGLTPEMSVFLPFTMANLHF